mmetsp:Transcript_22653/g.31604  ORF Transcript_22653/g.31604 Transcript_22653/m.31604 type:complete len:227 (-) Transcript_22653:253-933(-)
MKLQLLDASSTTPRTISLILGEQLSDQVFCFGRQMFRKPYLVFENTLISVVGVVDVFGHERRHSHQHFEDEHANRPQVNGFIVAFVRDELGGEIVGRAAKGVGLLIVLKKFSKTEVDQLDVPLGVDEKVLWLEVPVADVLVMQVLQGADDAGGVEDGHGLAEAAFGLVIQKREELASQTQLHEHVELRLVLEGGHEVDGEGVVNLLHHKLFVLHMLALPQVRNPLL